MTISAVPKKARLRVAATLALWSAATFAFAADIGQVKTSKGEVTITRSGATLPGPVGTKLEASDVLSTGADGAVGITMADGSLLSIGPNSVLSLDAFAFDPTTFEGKFDSTLSKGTLSVVSGKVAKGSPEAMKVRTPATVLGVRGTEFVVFVDG